MTGEGFKAWWADLSSNLKPGTEVFHWSAHSDYQLVGSFSILSVSADGVMVDRGAPDLPEHAQTKTRQSMRLTFKDGRLITKPVGPKHDVPIDRQFLVPRGQFYYALRIWQDYCAPVISRTSFNEVVRQSTYVISIIRWTEARSTRDGGPTKPPGRAST
jgi:hypothetical protein